MISWLPFLAQVAVASEFIVTFRYYGPRWQLLDEILDVSDDSCSHGHSDLLLVSDFLVLECPSAIALQFVGKANVKGVHPQRTFTRTIMSFLDDSEEDGSGNALDVSALWSQSIKGQGVAVAILDSGISAKARNTIVIKECINFTSEDSCEDDAGHGTFVASLFTSTKKDCLGLAPNSSIYIYKVFSRSQESNTSWFLEALNAALRQQVDIVNLSSGGIDYTDLPFTEKLQELVDAGITIVAAIGNDGPGFGTTNNPGEQLEVIGVGALTEDGKDVAPFSSRGPTLWEMNSGMGRVKPDIVALGSRVKGFANGVCTLSSGTSIATPIVSAALALVLTDFQNKVNPGMIKQALLKAGKRLKGVSAFEQGAGVFDLMGTFEAIRMMKPHFSVFPDYLNFTSDYLYPFNLQPLHSEVQTLVFNATLVSSLAATGRLSLVSTSSCHSAVSLQVDFEPQLRHWTSSLSLYISSGFPLNMDCAGNATIRIATDTEHESEDVTLKIIFRVAGETKRSKRILWDLYHSVKYPEGGRVMRDEDKGNYLFDWRGDHPFTNYLSFYTEVLALGYTVDFSPVEFCCIDGSMYSIYLLLDPETNFSQQEIKKIRYDVERLGVHLLVLTDWYDEMKVAKNLKLSNNILARDDTHVNSSGSAVPVLNNLLASYFMEFSKADAFSGPFTIGGKTSEYMLGTAITRFPQGGYLLTDYLQSFRAKKNIEVPVLGLYEETSGSLQGRIALFGDSSCFDPDLGSKDCLWLIEPLLNFLEHGEVDEQFFPAASKLPYDYDMHKEILLTIPLLNHFGSEPDCAVVPLDTGKIYIHNKSLIKLQTWSSSPEQAKERETKWVVYLERIMFLGFGLLALIIWVHGRTRRRSSDETLPSVDRSRRRRGQEEVSLVKPRRTKNTLNTLPIDVEL